MLFVICLLNPAEHVTYIHYDEQNNCVISYFYLLFQLPIRHDVMRTPFNCFL